MKLKSNKDKKQPFIFFSMIMMIKMYFLFFTH